MPREFKIAQLCTVGCVLNDCNYQLQQDFFFSISIIMLYLLTPMLQWLNLGPISLFALGYLVYLMGLGVYHQFNTGLTLPMRNCILCWRESSASMTLTMAQVNRLAPRWLCMTLLESAMWMRLLTCWCLSLPKEARRCEWPSGSRASKSINRVV